MRRTVRDQLPLVPTPLAHEHAHELQAVRAILDAHPEFAKWVQADLLAGGIDPDRGREGMSGEQVLRALVIKQSNGFSYEDLAFHLADSQSYRAFCLIGFADKTPKKSTLQRNLKCVRAETLERVNRGLVHHAQEQGIEDGQRLRSDSTVIEAAIHEPTDSSLLVDCVRVLVVGGSPISLFLIEILLAKGITPTAVAAAGPWADWLTGKGVVVARDRASLATALAAQSFGTKPWRVICGDPAAIPEAVELAGPRSTLTLLATAPLCLTPGEVLAREVTILGVAGAHPDLVVEAAATCVKSEIDLAGGTNVDTTDPQLKRPWPDGRTHLAGALVIEAQRGCALTLDSPGKPSR